MEDPKPESSVLIPKIEPENTGPVEAPVPEKQDLPEPAQTADPSQKGKVVWKKVGIGVGAFILFLLVAIGVPAFLTYQKGVVLEKSVKKLADSAKSQDLGQVKTNLTQTKKDLAGFKTSYTLLSWTRIIPFLGPYVSDLGHSTTAFQAGLDAGDLVLTTIQPYADLLGFKGGTDVLAAEYRGRGENCTGKDRFYCKKPAGFVAKN